MTEAYERAIAVAAAAPAAPPRTRDLPPHLTDAATGTLERLVGEIGRGESAGVRPGGWGPDQVARVLQHARLVHRSLRGAA